MESLPQSMALASPSVSSTPAIVLVLPSVSPTIWSRTKSSCSPHIRQQPIPGEGKRTTFTTLPHYTCSFICTPTLSPVYNTQGRRHGFGKGEAEIVKCSQLLLIVVFMNVIN